VSLSDEAVEQTVPVAYTDFTIMTAHPPDHCVVHPLPPAPQFVGREAELDDLRSLWHRGSRGAVALVGLGGAGKTALAAHFLEELCRREHPSRPEGLFVWSFYQEPDAGYFLSEAYRYFARGDSAPASAKGAGLLHLLRDALSIGGPHLLVLDGLERVQRQEGPAPGLFGQIEDPLLRGLLTRVAEGIGQTTALVTSRFPLTDLRPFAGRGYSHRDVEGLSLSAAVELLRRHGVHGNDDTLAQLVESYGAHALTLDHLGGLIGQFLGGDPSRAPEAPQLTSPGQDRQALRLARLLDAYQSHLPPAELALLGRLCLLERSIRLEQILPLFLCSPPVGQRTARHLEDLIRRIEIPAGFPAALGRELAESIRDTVAEAHQEMPIAGPEDAFVRSVYQAVEGHLERHELLIEDDVEEIVRLYGNQEVSHPTERRPLAWQDQKRLREFIVRYQEYRNHPLFSYKGSVEALEVAFTKAGWEKPSGPAFADLSPADVVLALRRARLALQQFAIKHRALVLVREQCRLYQQKRQSSGPLAMLDDAGLTQVLEALVGRHLVLREADGAMSVHPAVRDYFAQLATASERGFWHHVIGEQLVSLVQRPGLRLPEDQAALDLVEEAISHAQAAGQPEKAWNLYAHVLGGHRHLAWKLGEMARGLRILRGFDPCPDRWALGWYLRALGELDAAHAQNPFPFFRADIRLLQGRLTLVEQEGDPARTAIAEFLMGRTAKLPSNPLGCAVPRAQILLYQGRSGQAWLATEPEELYEAIGWEDDRSRCRLYRALVACRMGDSAQATILLDDAARWVLHSGSVEHLCLYHLARSHIAKQAWDVKAVERAVDDGLHLARQCGLGLYHVELLCVQAELFLGTQNSPAAAESSREAQRLASSPACQFAWGAAEAGHLLGRSLIALNRPAEARTVLEEVRALRLRIGDFRAEQTEGLIQSLGK
jgi:AAA ATPase domain